MSPASGLPEAHGESGGVTSTRRANAWWPRIHDTETARRVARQAFWAAIVVVVITLLLVGLAASGKPVGGVTPIALVDAALFALIALGIRRMSRVAAFAGLLLFGIEKLLMAQSMNVGNLVTAAALLFAFANGARATIAFHRLRSQEQKPAAGAPVAPE